MPDIITGIVAAGTLFGANESRKAGKRAQANAELTAAQLEVLAGQEIASSQREALEERRQYNLLESRALALAAASGGGASDPTVMRTIADIAGEGDYAARVALYEGEERAMRTRIGADATRREGADARKAGKLNAYATLLGGFSSLYGRYGRGGIQPAAPIEERALKDFPGFKYGG